MYVKYYEHFYVLWLRLIELAKRSDDRIIYRDRSVKPSTKKDLVQPKHVTRINMIPCGSNTSLLRA